MPSDSCLEKNYQGRIDYARGPTPTCPITYRTDPSLLRTSKYSRDMARPKRSHRSCILCAEITLIAVAIMPTRVMYCFDYHHSRSAMNNPPQPVTDSPLVSVLLSEPSTTTFLVCILGYCAAIGLHYYCSPSTRYQDPILVASAAMGIIIGIVSSLDLQGIIFRVLPTSILTASLIHSYASRFGLR
ncbi:uncharacterized protein F4822DRAFT_53087 [Hypoxylon trugodes]|uniref:uncharacterized protein n=1 Tax=Hypoxylon trugodes TaxID=326681 RepID=UPI002197ABF9|nr:uncharacterized protein F4822DRAFT_53087 [Hypoxylon trugodes]KAI1383828.1 hypothetical protein F4822DRAFT_53087 [Hypoxylon trugodes]